MLAMSAEQQQDERLSFAEVITLHQQAVYSYLLRFTRNLHDAQDLFQETFLRAHRAYPALPTDADLRAWLMRIAVNLSKNYVRDRQPIPPPQDAGIGSVAAVFGLLVCLPVLVLVLLA